MNLEKKHDTAQYRKIYASLIRLYPEPFRERFGEGMAQTFNDLLRERMESGQGLFGFILWTFYDTFVAIISERINFIMKSNFIVRISLITAFILLIPLVAMQLTNEVNWNLVDFVVAGVLLFGAGLSYELIARKGSNIVYRVAVGIAVATALLLIWIDLAVGIAGDSANGLMYLGVLVMGIGAIIVRFRPDGMARVLFATALAQILAAVIAVLAWGQYFEIFILNGFFIALWLGSAMLFRRASSMALKSN